MPVEWGRSVEDCGPTHHFPYSPPRPLPLSLPPGEWGPRGTIASHRFAPPEMTSRALVSPTSGR